MKLLKTGFCTISIFLLLMLFCCMSVFAESADLTSSSPVSSITAVSDGDKLPSEQASAEKNVEQAQQQALDAVLEPAAMPTILLWSILASLVMCAPVVVLVIIKRRHQKY